MDAHCERKEDETLVSIQQARNMFGLRLVEDGWGFTHRKETEAADSVIGRIECVNMGIQ